MSYDLLEELSAKSSMLEKSLTALGNRGRAFAEAEYKYRVALADKILQERDNGTPVTIISDVCRGDRSIAKLKLDRDVSEVVYKSAMEAINVYKRQMTMLENQIAREWGRSD